MSRNIRILQFSAGFQLGDAISQEMLEIQKMLKENGIDSELFSENIHKSDRSYVSKFNKARIKKDDVFVYHHSIHSEVLPFILKYPNKKILIYHNVTPSNFFEPYDLKFSYLLQEGRNDLSIIKEFFDYFLAVSEFNRLELLNLGISNVALFPLHLSFSKWKSIQSSPKSVSNKVQFLFVGRIAPNKKQDDLIRFAKIWKSKTNIPFQFNLIGYSNPNQQAYLEELEFMIRTYNLEENVKFVSSVNDSILSKYYMESDFFISMSEHEGFCVPLMEAMFFKLPVIAYDAGAVSETLGGSGILFNSKNFEAIADRVIDLLQNPFERNRLIENQSIRLKNFLNTKTLNPLLRCLNL
ncbi:MAG: glycosyltransferase family 4 protein [Leptospira sp.]|nr:glycosyltransferase family 4 protein [Leptospira sp.]